MIPVFSALAPVFLMIALGYVLKKRTIVSDAFWSPAEKTTYFLFFPALLLTNTAKAEFGDIDVLPMILASCFGVLVVLQENTRTTIQDFPTVTDFNLNIGCRYTNRI